MNRITRNYTTGSFQKKNTKPGKLGKAILIKTSWNYIYFGTFKPIQGFSIHCQFQQPNFLRQFVVLHLTVQRFLGLSEFDSNPKNKNSLPAGSKAG